jgi:hypothetical protein
LWRKRFTFAGEKPDNSDEADQCKPHEQIITVLVNELSKLVKQLADLRHVYYWVFHRLMRCLAYHLILVDEHRGVKFTVALQLNFFEEFALLRIRHELGQCQNATGLVFENSK